MPQEFRRNSKCKVTSLAIGVAIPIQHSLGSLCQETASAHSPRPPPGPVILLQNTDPPATLNSLGTSVTIATWVVLVAVNLWCLRKLLRGGAVQPRRR